MSLSSFLLYYTILYYTINVKFLINIFNKATLIQIVKCCVASQKTCLIIIIINIFKKHILGYD